MSDRFPLRFRYGMTRWGSVQHFVWTDEHGRPERFTVCGRRWAFLAAERTAAPVCQDCELNRKARTARGER